MENKKTYRVSVDTTSFYVGVEAKNEDEAREIVQRELEEGEHIDKSDDTYYEVGNDIEEVQTQFVAGYDDLPF